MTRLRATIALPWAIGIALSFATNVGAVDNCGDIDVDRGPALRVIAEECRAQSIESSTCGRIANNAVRRLMAM